MGRKIERFVIKISDSNPQVSEDKKLKDSNVRVIDNDDEYIEEEDDFVFVSEMRYKDYEIEFFRNKQDGKYYWQASYDGEDRKLSNFNVWVTVRGIKLSIQDEEGYPTKADAVAKAKEEINDQKRRWKDSKKRVSDYGVSYVENYKGVKIYRAENDEGFYIATVYRQSLEDPSLWGLKSQIDNVQNEHDKKYRNLDSKHRVVDMNAEEIINLINEAGAKGRSWYWLKGKLPSEFLSLYNKGYLFPVKNNSRNQEGVVNLTKPRELEETINWEVFKEYEVLKDELNILYDKYGAKTSGELERTISKLHKEEDSISRRALIESDKEKMWKLENGIDNILRKAGIKQFGNYYYSDFYNKRDFVFNKGDYLKELRKSWDNKRYKENQRTTVIKSQKGWIESDDDKVVPLTPEAEAYIRRIMRESDTEDIKRKRTERSNRRRSYYNSKDILDVWEKDRNKLKELLDDLKKLQNRGTMEGLRYEGSRDEYNYTGKGPYDYRGNYVGSSRGGYEYTGKKTKPYTEVKGLEGGDQKPLTSAITRAFNAKTVSDLRKALEDALDAVKFLPDDTDKITEAKQRIVDFIEEKKTDMYARRESYTKRLPDKKFKDGNMKIYLFPIDMIDKQDLDEMGVYDLEVLGENRGAYDEENNYIVKGTERNLKNYCRRWLGGYELHPDYLYDEDDFAGDIIELDENQYDSSDPGDIAIDVKEFLEGEYEIEFDIDPQQKTFFISLDEIDPDYVDLTLEAERWLKRHYPNAYWEDKVEISEEDNKLFIKWN